MTWLQPSVQKRETQELLSHQKYWVRKMTSLHSGHPNYTSCFKLSKGQIPSSQEDSGAICLPPSHAWQVVSLFLCLFNKKQCSQIKTNVTLRFL